MQEFFGDVCKIDSKALIDCNTLYAAYILWCIDNHAEPCTRKELGTFIKAQGGRKMERHGCQFWKGVDISEEYKKDLKKLGHYREISLNSTLGKEVE